MASILLTGPAIEPISLEETKTFLRIEHNDEDQLIAALIAGARSHIEAQTQTALITQDWRVVLDAWPQRGRIIVRPGPLKALNATRVFDCNGDPHMIDPQAVAPVWRQFRCGPQWKGFAANTQTFRCFKRHHRCGSRRCVRD
jgi:uncharacterized phiE125 gp8 family phage protein